MTLDMPWWVTLSPDEERAMEEKAAQYRANPGMDFDLTYYLSGPMKGYPDHNWPAFQHACDVLRRTGLKIVSPHEVTADANVNVPVEYPMHFLKADLLEMLAQTQGIILLKGWPKSYGARVELQLALSLEFPVWYFDNYQLTNMNGAI